MLLSVGQGFVFGCLGASIWVTVWPFAGMIGASIGLVFSPIYAAFAWKVPFRRIWRWTMIPGGVVCLAGGTLWIGTMELMPQSNFWVLVSTVVLATATWLTMTYFAAGRHRSQGPIKTHNYSQDMPS